MSTKILIVEDNQRQALQIAKALEDHGFTVEIDSNAEDALDSINAISYDVAIIDISLPSTDGIELMQQIRGSGIKIPLIALSGLNDEKKKLACFKYADDYVAKPCSFEELSLRITAIRRRYAGFASAVVNCGNLAIDTFNRIAEVSGRALHLTKKEYIMLELMIMRQGSLISKEVFLNMMYRTVSEEPGLKILDVYNFKLRKKLSDAGADVTIGTAWGRGSMLVSTNKDVENNIIDSNHINITDINESINENNSLNRKSDNEFNNNHINITDINESINENNSLNRKSDNEFNEYMSEEKKKSRK